MLRRRTSVISLPALKKKSSIGCSPKRRRLEPSVMTTTRDLTRRKDRTSSSWQKQSDSHATWSPSERIFLLRWPTALRRYCSRCTKTTKGDKSEKIPTTPQSLIFCRRVIQGCAEGSPKSFSLPGRTSRSFARDAVFRASHGRQPGPVYTIFISQPSTFSSGLIFHARFFAAP